MVRHYVKKVDLKRNAQIAEPQGVSEVKNVHDRNSANVL
jgi:hypothetical protein